MFALASRGDARVVEAVRRERVTRTDLMESILLLGGGGCVVWEREWV